MVATNPAINPAYYIRGAVSHSVACFRAYMEHVVSCAECGATIAAWKYPPVPPPSFGLCEVGRSCLDELRLAQETFAELRATILAQGVSNDFAG